MTMNIVEDGAKRYASALAKAMRETREQLLGSIFLDEYNKRSNNIVQLVYIRRGRYEVWKGNKRLAKRIKHRKEALALIKLIRGNEE